MTREEHEQWVKEVRERWARTKKEMEGMTGEEANAYLVTKLREKGKHHES